MKKFSLNLETLHVESFDLQASFGMSLGQQFNAVYALSLPACSDSVYKTCPVTPDTPL